MSPCFVASVGGVFEIKPHIRKPLGGSADELQTGRLRSKVNAKRAYIVVYSDRRRSNFVYSYEEATTEE